MIITFKVNCIYIITKVTPVVPEAAVTVVLEEGDRA